VKNLQAPEKRTDSQTIDVHSIFYTIQGEGPFCGTPAVFIRLAGCNLQCPGCDTDYTSKRARMQVSLILEDILKYTGRLINGVGLIVITGGEPFRQNIQPLIDALLAVGYYVQIETNGTLEVPHPQQYNLNPYYRQGVFLVCSPKTGKVHSTADYAACCYKYVMDAHNVDPKDGLPTFALDHTASPRLARPPKDIPIYLQPEDSGNPEQNKRNLEACIASCMRHGYILQLQVHKIIGVQ
jgi:organic radical activating enzyme